MARQPRPPRGPYSTRAPRQPHGPQRPRGMAAPAMGLGSRAVGAAKSGGNVLKEALYSLADFISKLLRRIFGKVMGSDLDQKREAKRDAVDREQAELDRLKSEKSDLERDLSRERDSQGEPLQSQKQEQDREQRSSHSKLLDEYAKLGDSGAGKPGFPHQLAGSAPALGAGGAASAGAKEGAAAILTSGGSDWRKALESLASGETAAGDLTRYDVLSDLHKGDPYSRESVEKAIERVQAIQASGAVESGDSTMFELLTCTAYIEAAAQNAKVKMHGPQDPELVAGDVEERVTQIMSEVAEHGTSPGEWTSALSAKATLSIRQAESVLHPDHGKRLGRDHRAQITHDGGAPMDGDEPSDGPRPGLPGPGGPSMG